MKATCPTLHHGIDRAPFNEQPKNPTQSNPLFGTIGYHKRTSMGHQIGAHVGFRGSFGFEGANGGPYLPYDFRDLTTFVGGSIYTERTLGRCLVEFRV